MTSRRVWRSDETFFPHYSLEQLVCAVATCLWFIYFAHYVAAHFIINFFQELKIEGEQPEVLEEDNLDLMLPEKKKKAKKVEFDEGDTLDKDDGENKLINGD